MISVCNGGDDAEMCRGKHNVMLTTVWQLKCCWSY